MTREGAKKILPILTAFVEGKVIQVCNNTGTWADNERISLYNLSNWPEGYRIKPEPTYRPFKDGAECWEEMKKHEPFGWTKFQCDFFQIIHVDDHVIGYGSACGTIIHSKFEDIFKDTTFADGAPFGMKEE